LTNPVNDLRERLRTLASNLLWVWHPGLREFLQGLAPGDEAFARNPVAGLRALGDETLASWQADKTFLKNLVAAEDLLARELAAARERCPGEFRNRILAYFSAEYGIHKSLPIYSRRPGCALGRSHQERARPGPAPGHAWACSTGRAISPSGSTSTASRLPAWRPWTRRTCPPAP
jgi:starch phosphorylase